MKILFVSHVANFQKFNRPFMRWFHEQGWEVHYASLDDETVKDADKFHRIDFRRNPVSPKNIKAFFQMIRLYRQEKFDIVHCHTPVGGIIARAAAVFFPKLKVIYTVHGFHFFKGAPKKNFLLYKTAEALLARRTDALVTVNKEDYEAAKRFHLHKGGKAYHIDGVGVDTDKIRNASPDIGALRKSLGIPEDGFAVLTVAELIKRKNYPYALKAFAEASLEKGYYLICGNVIPGGDSEAERLHQLTKELGIEDRVIFAGYRKDIADIVKASDVFLFTSTQEGLSIAIIEAMAGGLPVIASEIRGNTELVTDNGILCGVHDVKAYSEALRKLYGDPELRRKMSACSMENSRKYDVGKAVESMAEIYKKFMN
ncbi:MAG: glycosyltransferase family 4 protein [Huintestinicola sp.]